MKDVAVTKKCQKIVNISFYPYGVQYYRAPTPRPEEWADDLREIARSGFKMIQLRPQWRTHERIRGKFVWDDIDRLMELANKNGLKVIIKPMLECAPDWIYTELDGYRRTFGGQKLMPEAMGAFYVGGWLPCFDNPAVQGAAVDFVKAMVERYCSDSSLLLWNAWNEPRSRPLGECQCEHSIQSYREYLKKHFGTVEALNEKFGKAWTDFSTITPPNYWRDYADMFLWRQWAFEAVARRVAMVANAIRSIDKFHLVMSHVGCSMIIQDIACDSSDDYLTSKTVDFYGCSLPINLYPETMKDASGGSMICDWLRAVDENYWCHEIYPIWAGWDASPDKSVQRRQLWTALACGAKGIVFWQYRSERFGDESNGHGLREINGTSTDRSEVAEEFAAVLMREGEQFIQTSVPHSKVAILYDRQSDLLSRIQCMQDDLIREPTRLDYPYKLAVQGAYLGLWLNDVRSDWIATNNLHLLNRYACVIVPSLEIANQDIIDALGKFVEQGGKLIVEFPFASRGENTWLLPDRPGFGAERFLGVREAMRLNVEQEEIAMPGNETFVVADTKIVFKPASNARILGYWKDQSVAVVENDYGNGKVLSIGGSLSLMTIKSNRDVEVERKQWHQLLNLLEIDSNGVLTKRWTGLESRILESKQNTYLILINHSKEEGFVELSSRFNSYKWSYVFSGDKSKNMRTSKMSEIHISAGEVVCLKADKEK